MSYISGSAKVNNCEPVNNSDVHLEIVSHGNIVCVLV